MWVARPDLVPVASEVFDRVLGNQPHQKQRLHDEIRVTAADLLDIRVPGGRVTEAGIRNNLSVTLQYLDSWLCGSGAVAIFNLMEDTATAEIARSQRWHWHANRVRLDDGRILTDDVYGSIRTDDFVEFLTLPGS